MHIFSKTEKGQTKKIQSAGGDAENPIAES